MQCPCQSGASYADCCAPLITGARPAETAEQLMRSRYSAYVMAEIDYLLQSWHPRGRQRQEVTALRDFARGVRWLGLEVLATQAGRSADEQGEVEFVARFEQAGQPRRLHERSTFVRHRGRWVYRDGVDLAALPQQRATPKVGRNEICPCGSGRKYKKCCGR